MLTNAFFKTRTDGKELSNSSMVGRSSETEFTVSLWGFPSGLIQTYGQGIHTINGSFYDTNNPGGYFRILIFPGGGVKVQTAAGGVGGQLILGNADSPIEMNKWFHLMLVLENNTLNIFVNGQDKTSLATVTGTISTMPSLFTGAYKNYMLGYFGSTTYSWQGSLVHVAQWDSDKSSDISTIYNNGKPGDLTSLSPKNWWKLTDGSLVDSGSESDNAVALSTLPTIVATNVNSNSNPGISSGMTTANLVTSDLTRSIPYSSYSMFFDGIDDVVQITRNANLEPTNISISCWVNVTASGSHASGYFVSKIHTSGASVSYGIYKPATPTFVINVGGVIKSSPAYGTDIQGQGWHHLVGTYDGANIRLYVNGAEVGSGTAETGSIDYTTEDAYIGSFEPSSLEIDGNISNAAIFTSALTQDQILTIYNGGVPNSISSLSPVSWWSLAGDSYFNGTNWICPDLGSGGNNGTSGGMGGTELVGDGPGSTANGIATSMNIPGNLQGNAPNSSKNAFSINMTAIDRIDYDAEAKAFINAAGITDATQQLAIKTLVSSLQSDNLWTNMKAIYPMVGGTSTTHKYNLRNPLDSDAGFRLVFDGGWTHSATGATPGGVNGRANSHLVPSNDISSKDAMSFGYYSRDTSDANGLGYDMGSYQAGDISILVIKYVNLLWYSINQNTYTKPANTNTDGFFVSNRSASNAIQVYRNGSSFHTAANLSTDLSAADFGIGGIYGTPGYGNKECAFAFIYDGSLDATQNLNLYNAVQAFNTTLGRQV